MPGLRFGLIGTGFMGRAHTVALSSVGAVFPDIEAPICELLADTSAERAKKAASALGFARSTGDWRELVRDPQVDVVDICTPNHLHHEMALAAIEAGKHVYCEKPLALDIREAREIASAAKKAGVRHVIGFNYICNPMLQVAREMIAAGELGQIFSFRGRYLEDYMSDPASPYTWRCKRVLAGSGALADLGSHLVSMARYLLGDITRVNGNIHTIHKQRKDPATQKMLDVENEDISYSMVDFANGATGTFEISRVATGVKCGLGFRIFGTKGSLVFDQERMNELAFYSGGDPQGRRGYRTILAGPEHPDYASFCPAPGHGLGINDLKVIELRNVIRGIVSGTPAYPNFQEGYEVQQVMEAVERSHAAGSAWVEVRS
jgi:predicted dehydrogenase